MQRGVRPGRVRVRRDAERERVRGLVRCAAPGPGVVALLAAPGLVVALALGALTALVLDRGLGLI